MKIDELHKEYPGLWRICFEITLGCGGLYRGRSANMICDEFNSWLSKIIQEDDTGLDFKAISAFGLSLSPEDLSTLAEGEETEALIIQSRGPRGLEDLTQDYFENVG